MKLLLAFSLSALAEELQLTKAVVRTARDKGMLANTVFLHLPGRDIFDLRRAYSALDAAGVRPSMPERLRAETDRERPQVKTSQISFV